MLPPYAKLPCHKVAHAGNSTSSYSIQPFCIAAFLATAVYIFWNLPLILDVHQFFCWNVLACIYRYAFRHILGFSPPFLYFGDEHVSWSTFSHKWHIFVFLIFFNVLPRACYGYIQWEFIPSAVWKFSNYFSSSRCRNLALNRIFLLYFRGRHGGCLT